MTTAALGVAVTGVAVSLLPHVTQYLRADGLAVAARPGPAHAAVERLVGLGRFEEPRFLNRLRLAQMTAGAMPNQVVDGLLGVIRSVVMMSGFLGSLLLVDPSLALLVFGAGLPASGAEIALSRDAGQNVLGNTAAERREMFYSQLLSNAVAQKEVRLFGTGPFLRGLMLAERRVANSAKRAVDRREAIVQSALGLTAGLAAGAGMLWAVERGRPRRAVDRGHHPVRHRHRRRAGRTGGPRR